MKYWLLFEVVVFLSYLFALCIYLLQQYIFKVPSLWNEIAEITHWKDIWLTKNAMDFLHYYNFESEAFALYT